MSEMIEINEPVDRFILVGVAVNDKDDTGQSLDELEELVYTAGAVTVGRVIQNRENIHPTTYIGKGKIDEVRELAEDVAATGIVCDDELSPVQLRNLEDALQLAILDRTSLILDIFAQRALSREAKLQVELAQLRYRSTRLTGKGSSLSRLGGGIGTRGPGEKKLESDRRLIKERIGRLKQELEETDKNRETVRSLRNRSKIPVVAIVGYTNAGKSTLLNYLTDANVLEEDKLFATLEPITRSFKLADGQQVLFTDTVGFIRKLPHHLVESFKSTLMEAKYADIILHVVDSSNPDAYKQMHVVYETLASLGIKDKPVITVFNKQDIGGTDEVMKDLKADYTVRISARTGQDVDKLLELIEIVLKKRNILIERTFSYQEAGRIQAIRKYGQLINEEYREDGIYIKAYIPKDIYDMLSAILQKTL